MNLILLALAALAVWTVNGCDLEGVELCLTPFMECAAKQAGIEEATGKSDACGCYSGFSDCAISKMNNCNSSAIAQICEPINGGAELLGCSYRCSGATPASIPALSIAAALILARLLI